MSRKHRNFEISPDLRIPLVNDALAEIPRKLLNYQSQQILSRVVTALRQGGVYRVWVT